MLPDATKPEIKAAVELMFKVEVESGADRQRARASRSASAASSAGGATGRRPTCRLKPGQEINFAGGGAKIMALSKSNRHRPAAARWSRSSTRACTRAGRSPRSSRSKKRGSGRNNNGHITMRHKGGGHKQHYRIVDFKRNKDGIAGEGRAARIRPEPQRAPRAAAVHRWRAPLHHRAARRRRRARS